MFIRNIIIDLGEVIIPLSFGQMVKNFEALGLPHFDEFYRQHKSDLFDPFELGSLSPAQFRQALRTHFDVNPKAVSDQQLDTAWNAWLGVIPEERLLCLRKLKEQGNYRIFLFSNTNPIHLDEIYKRHGVKVFQGCFDTEYYSFRLGQKKPNRQAFISILNKHGLNAGETVHVDDTLEHLAGAKSAGLQVIHVVTTGQEEKSTGLTTVKSLLEAVSFIEAQNRPRFEKGSKPLVQAQFFNVAEAERPKKSFFSCCFSFFECCKKKEVAALKREEYQYLSSEELNLSL